MTVIDDLWDEARTLRFDLAAMMRQRDEARNEAAINAMTAMAAIDRARAAEIAMTEAHGEVVAMLARLKVAERVVDAARSYFAEAYIKHTETGIPPQDEGEEPTCVGCIVEGDLNAALLAYDAAKAVTRG